MFNLHATSHIHDRCATVKKNEETDRNSGQ